MDTAMEKIQHAVEDGWSGHKDHAWADRDQAQGRAQLVSNSQRADNAGEQGRAEWLQEDVGAVVRQAPAKNGAGRRTHEYESRCR